jgi:beta-phosphoglucomutase-like phosphatase (HAD superfamily)
VRAAKSAGMKCVALASNQTVDTLREADLIIDTFENLTFPNVCFQLEKNV